MLQAIMKPAALTACLFAGPCLQSCLPWAHGPSFDKYQRLQSLRNLIMAPLTEEFCFRACMAPLFLLEVTPALDVNSLVRPICSMWEALALHAEACKATPAFCIVDLIMYTSVILDACYPLYACIFEILLGYTCMTCSAQTKKSHGHMRCMV